MYQKDFSFHHYKYFALTGILFIEIRNWDTNLFKIIRKTDRKGSQQNT